MNRTETGIEIGKLELYSRIQLLGMQGRYARTDVITEPHRPKAFELY